MPTPRTKEDEFIRLVKLIKEHLEAEGWDLKNSDYEIGHLAVIFRDEIQSALQSRDEEIRKFTENIITPTKECSCVLGEGYCDNCYEESGNFGVKRILDFLNNRA